MRVKLYTYFRSSAAYRVRIALNLKQVACELAPVHLVRDGGHHRRPAFRAINPQMRVPALALDGDVLVQSLAIIEYLDETHPEPPLLPRDPLARAKVRAVAQIVACDIHPLNKSGTLAYLRGPLGQDDKAVEAWYAHWVITGFEAIEALIRPGPFAFGTKPGLADLCIVPQVYNARRFKVPLDAFPRIRAVDLACQDLGPFIDARPENQPDAE
jgi:maleylacetoacetate isomerase